MDRIEAATRELVAALRDELATRQEAAPARLLTIPDAADALSIGRSTLYEEIAAGRLRSVKVGRRRLIPAESVAAYIGTAAS
jgi:excisionase family DNA binding protein